MTFLAPGSPMVFIGGSAGEFGSSGLDALRWASTTGVRRPHPEDVSGVGDGTSAAAALRQVERGRYLLYRGHYANALQLLPALRRRLSGGARSGARGRAPIDAYRVAREAKQREHDLLCRLVIPLSGTGYRPLLDGAPALGDFGIQVWGPSDGRPLAVPLREWVGARGAREWYRRGVEVPALGARVHPHYGVFAPIRGEYVDLIAAQADAIGMAGRTAFDIGTGTGVLALVLARRGASRVVATDVDPRAVACARENVARMTLETVVGVCQVVPDDPFPSGSADVLVCNPPWIPVEAPTRFDRAVFDPAGRFLLRFLDGISVHLRRGGQAWLVLSDFAERLGLRPPNFVAAAAGRAGLVPLGRRETRARHPRAMDPDDPLNPLRSRETITLHVLGRR
jgi:SAM-dependent methyltransferase